MRKDYVLDAARRQARALAGDAEAPGWRRRARVRLAATACLALGAFGVGWWWFTPPDAPVAAAVAPVPEHQRSGPLANPWGNAAPVTSTRAEDGAGAAASAPAASTAGPSAASTAEVPPAARTVPPAGDAVRQALARLRGAGKAGEFVSAALQGGETAALTVAWMAERQCRQWTHWRQMTEWRMRATPDRAADRSPGPGPSATPGLAEAASCEAMPAPALVESALSAAGFPSMADAASELTRRPIDFALAVAVGDPLLLAEVLEASDIERAGQQLLAWGADARDLLSPDVLRAAVWLASCWPLDATGRPGNSSALKAACRDHPALRLACMHQGLCDARDLRDLLLRSLPASELGAAERLARWLAPRMGR